MIILGLVAVIVGLARYANEQRRAARLNYRYYLIAMDGWRGSDEAWRSQHQDLLKMVERLAKRDGVDPAEPSPSASASLVH